MTPIEIYGPLKQARTAFDVLEILSDPKKLKELKGVLKGIEDERDRLNAAIATFGKAKSIDRLHNNASNKEAEAHRVLEAAQAEAKETKAKAQSGIDETRGMLQHRELAVAAGEKKLGRRTVELTAELDNREAELSKREVAATKREAKLTSQTETLQKRQEEYGQRKQMLDAAYNSIRP